MGVRGPAGRAAQRRAAVRAATAGKGPLQAARAAAAAVRQVNAAQTKQAAQKASRTRSSVARVLGPVVRAAQTAAAAISAGDRATEARTRSARRWTWWGLRAARAWQAGQPLPPRPDQAQQTKEAQQRAQEADGVDPAAVEVARRMGRRLPVSALVAQPAQWVTRTVNAASDNNAGQPGTGPAGMTGGQVMAVTGSSLGLMLEQHAQEMRAVAARYEPAGMVQWGADMRHLPLVLHEVAQAIAVLQSHSQHLPIEPPVRDALGSVVRLLHRCGEAADEIHTTFRRVHAKDLARHETPRPNEQMWDRRANQ
jgi:hypothetical protein